MGLTELKEQSYSEVVLPFIDNINEGTRLVRVEIKNFSQFKILADEYVIKEIVKYFSFRDPLWQVKKKRNPKLFRWDGMVHLFDKRGNTLPSGLLKRLYEFCKERKYKLELDDVIKNHSRHNITDEEITNFLSTLDLPFSLRDYQVASLKFAINWKRSIVVASTGSGKSAIQAVFTEFVLTQIKEKNKVCIVVPNIGLVEQLYKDFISYGCKHKIHKITGGVEKENEARIFITTYQSLMTIKDPKYFAQFEAINWDEIHIANSSHDGKSFINLMKKFTHAHWRLGTTGTTRTDNISIFHTEAYFGPIFRATSTNELQKEGTLTPVKITTHKIIYSNKITEQVDRLDWDKQQSFYEDIRNPRQDYIMKLAMELEGNTLILFRAIEHGKYMYEELLKRTSKPILYVDGSVSGTDRMTIVKFLEDNNGCIAVTSYGTFSTGINCKRLHSVIFAASSKSPIRIPQSIGRLLRKHHEKECAYIHDIVDAYKYPLKHYEARKVMYNDEKWEIDEKEVDIHKFKDEYLKEQSEKKYKYE